ncbi:MAG TPA: tRNA uridine-5-carboxymethylaminomethyl(34) synthesis GTPase MnmE [Caulobacteraceae bacterium]
MTDAIFALATAPGRAAVAVMRLSGVGTRALLDGLGISPPPAREARLRRLRGPDGAVLDQALVLWTPGPGSYTGEDGAELHLHGGSAVVDAVTRALIWAGARLAEPGEFTRRAFEHGKLDLAQAEAVADLVDAETEGQRRQALAQFDGALGRRYAAWREALLEALAHLDAAIDFPDEDLPADVAARARPPLEALETELAAALAGADRGEQVREGYRIAIVGAPNAGKSSLLNRLAGREAAIVTAIPGTTRDVIEAPLAIGGFKVLLADTAGLRDTADLIESEGVRRARAWAESAALRFWVVDASSGEEAFRQSIGAMRPGDILVLNKSDLPAGADAAEARALGARQGLEAFEVSAATGEGLDALQERLHRRIALDLAGGEFPAATRARHRGRLEEALAALRRGLAALEAPELAAEDLRLAGRALGRVSGRIDPEEVLGRIFASFCIGK